MLRGHELATRTVQQRILEPHAAKAIHVGELKHEVEQIITEIASGGTESLGAIGMDIDTGAVTVKSGLAGVSFGVHNRVKAGGRMLEEVQERVAMVIGKVGVWSACFHPQPTTN